MASDPIEAACLAGIRAMMRRVGSFDRAVPDIWREMSPKQKTDARTEYGAAIAGFLRAHADKCQAAGFDIAAQSYRDLAAEVERHQC